MAIEFVNLGTNASGTSPVTPAYNATVYAGNLALLVVTNKYPTNGPSTPAGWTLLGQASGGSGASGADSGDVYVTVFYKILDGTETGTVSVTVTSSNSTSSQIYAFTRWPITGTNTPYTNSGDGWDIAQVSGTDTSVGTDWVVASSSQMELKYGDVIVACTAVNTNLYTSASPVITATAVEMFTTTARADFGSAAGDNQRQVVSTCPVVGGIARPCTLGYTATLSGTAGSAPAGVTMFVRLRETSPRLRAKRYR